MQNPEMNPAITLGSCFRGRDNGFTALRLALALAVVVGHSFELGGFGPDPLLRISGTTLGELAVNGFFAISGFLVTRSLLLSSSLRSFALKRALRILPGLWVCLLLTGLVLFPLLDEWRHARDGAPLHAYTEAIRYVFANVFVRVGQAGVDGLFIGQPASGVVNNSLWSLWPEVLCYAALLLLGAIGLLPRRIYTLALALGVALGAHWGGVALLGAVLPGLGEAKVWYVWRLMTQAAFFFAGGCLWVGRDQLSARAGWRTAALVATLLALATSTYAWFGPLTLPYALIALALHLRGGIIEKFGDLSYGIYIYHYPLMQTLIFWQGFPILPPIILLQTLALTLPLALASWSWIESPALRLKEGARPRAAVAV